MMLRVCTRCTLPRTCGRRWEGAKAGAGRSGGVGKAGGGGGQRRWRRRQARWRRQRSFCSQLALAVTDTTARPGAGAVSAMTVATRKHSGSQCFKAKAFVACAARRARERHSMVAMRCRRIQRETVYPSPPLHFGCGSCSQKVASKVAHSPLLNGGPSRSAINLSIQQIADKPEDWVRRR